MPTPFVTLLDDNPTITVRRLSAIAKQKRLADMLGAVVVARREATEVESYQHSCGALN